jgi:hypothetical protein
MVLEAAGQAAQPIILVVSVATMVVLAAALAGLVHPLQGLTALKV